MSRFVNIPNQDEGVVRLLNSDDISEVLLMSDVDLYITKKGEQKDQIVINFESHEAALDFIDQNFILLNK